MALNLGTGQRKAFAQSINRARFEITDDFQIPGQRPMLLTSGDILASPGRGQSVQLKDITIKCFAPLCYSAGPPPVVNVLPAVSIYGLQHSYTFYININGGLVMYPVTFFKNVDSEKSELYFADYDIAVKSLEVSVVQNFAQPPFFGPGINYTLSVLIETFPYNFGETPIDQTATQ